MSAGESCPLCGAPLGSEQEWCLRCGGAARTRLAAIPNWRAPLAALGLTIVLALGALTAALVSLAGESGSSVASTTPLTRTVVAPAAVTPVPTTPATASPLATTPTARAPGVLAPGGAKPGTTASEAVNATPNGVASATGARTGTTGTIPAVGIPVLGGLGKSAKGKAALERLERRAGNHQTRTSPSPAG
jgi:hypothetical protein